MTSIFQRPRMKKRGSLQDLILVMVILLSLAITIIFSALITREIQNSGMFDDRGTVNHSRARAIFGITRDRVLPTFDNIFIGTLVAGMLGVVILSFAVRSLPVFFVTGFVFITVLMLLAPILANVYDAVATHPLLVADADDFTAIDFVFSNFPLIILAAAVLVSITIYGLFRVAT